MTRRRDPRIVEEELFTAIREDDRDSVAELLEEGQFQADAWSGGYLRRAVQNGSMVVLELLQEKGGVLSPELYQYCLPTRQLEMVQYLLAEGIPFQPEPGHIVPSDYPPNELDLFPRPSDARSMAIYRLLGGSWRIPDMKGMVQAVKRGDLALLQRYKEAGYPLEEQRDLLFLVACHWGRLELLQDPIFHPLLPFVDEEELLRDGGRRAIMGDSLPVLRWLSKRGKLIWKDYCNLAASTGRVELCQWLHRRTERADWNGCCMSTLTSGRYHTAIWMTSIGLIPRPLSVSVTGVIKGYNTQLHRQRGVGLAETLCLLYKLGVNLHEQRYPWALLATSCKGPGELSDALCILLVVGVPVELWEEYWNNGQMSVYVRALLHPMAMCRAESTVRVTAERVVQKVEALCQEYGLN